MDTTSETRYDIDALCALVELPRRTVRYYIQQGLVDRPHGAKRAAYYTHHHLEQLLALRKWQQAGLSLDRIRELLAQPDAEAIPPLPRRPGSVEVWSHLYIHDGVELLLEPGRAGLTPEQTRQLLAGVLTLYEQITQAKGNQP